MIFTWSGEALALYFLLRLFESAMLCLLLKLTLGKRWDANWHGAVVFICFSAMQILRGTIETQNPLINMALNLGSDFFITLVFYQAKLWKRIALLALFYAMMFVCDAASLIIAALFKVIEPQTVDTIESIPMLVMILSRALLPALIIGVSKMYKKGRADVVKTSLLAPVFMFAAALLIAFFPVGGERNLLNMSRLLFFVSCLMLSTALITFIVALLRYMHKAGSYNHELYKENQMLKAVKHDLGNHFRTAESLGYTAYMESLQKRMDEVLIDTGNHVVNAILFNKQKEMEQLSVALEASGALPDDMSWLNPMDMSIILGNALDNAAEAVSKLGPEQRMPVNVRLSYQGHMIVIIVKNASPANGIVDFKSTKQEPGHGYGIANIKKAVDRYGGHMELGAYGGVVKLSILLQAPSKYSEG